MSPTPAIHVTEPTVPGGPIHYSEYEIDPDNPFAAGAAWVDGEFVPIGEARIPLRDSGFTHSDVTYTVAQVWHGRIFRLDDHIERLLNGAKYMRLVPPLTREQIREIALECVVLAELRESYVNITITRGVGARPRDAARTDGPPAQIYFFAIPYTWVFTPREQLEGVSAIVPLKSRRVGRNQIDPQVKNYQWGDLIQGEFEALDRNARTAILLDADGFVAEGPGFNVALIKDGVLASPGQNALLGVTRRTVFQIAEAMGVKTELRDVTEQELHEADEILACTTAGGVTPVVELDGKPVGSGAPGPIVTEIQRRYWELMDDPQSPHSEPVPYRD